MDPEVKSMIGTALLGVSTTVATYAAARGIIPGGDQATVANDLVSVALFAIAGLIGWYKKRQSSLAVVIPAINADKTNGVKVVDERSPSPAVSGPLK